MARQALVVVNRRVAVARVIVEEVDHPGDRSVDRRDVGAVDLPRSSGAQRAKGRQAGTARRWVRGGINELRCSTWWVVETARRNLRAEPSRRFLRAAYRVAQRLPDLLLGAAAMTPRGSLELGLDVVLELTDQSLCPDGHDGALSAVKICQLQPLLIT